MKRPEKRYKAKRLKEYRKLLMSNKCFDWDFTSILYVERLQMLRVAKAIQREDIRHENWERDVRWIKLAVKILDVYLTDSWWDLDENGEMTVPKVNIKNFKRFCPSWDTVDDRLKRQALYEEKLWYLYNKIRLYKLRRWWT